MKSGLQVDHSFKLTTGQPATDGYLTGRVRPSEQLPAPATGKPPFPEQMLPFMEALQPLMLSLLPLTAAFLPL
eukprot:3274962-Rhodomonas_salina.3